MRGRHKRFSEDQKARMVAHYCEDRMSLRDIAAAFETSQTSVWKVLAARGVVRRSERAEPRCIAFPRHVCVYFAARAQGRETVADVISRVLELIVEDDMWAALDVPPPVEFRGAK